MRVFLSWSGDTSKAVALALREWLPLVIQQLQPWMSSEDIPKGTTWFNELNAELVDGSYSVVCLTSTNLDQPWINFEVGALAGKTGDKRVCTALFDVSRASVTGPLSVFQSTLLSDRGDVLKLLQTLNRGLGPSALEDGRLQRAFETYWASLESSLSEIGQDEINEQHLPQRDDRSILEEILDLARANVPTDKRLPREAFRTISDGQVALEDGAVVAVGSDVWHPSIGVGRVVGIQPAEKGGPSLMAIELWGPGQGKMVSVGQPFPGWKPRA